MGLWPAPLPSAHHTRAFPGRKSTCCVLGSLGYWWGWGRCSNFCCSGSERGIDMLVGGRSARQAAAFESCPFRVRPASTGPAAYQACQQCCPARWTNGQPLSRDRRLKPHLGVDAATKHGADTPPPHRTVCPLPARLWSPEAAALGRRVHTQPTRRRGIPAFFPEARQAWQSHCIRCLSSSHLSGPHPPTAAEPPQ